MRILRVRELVLIGSFCLSLWAAYPALGQPTGREWERLEQQVDRLTESSGADAVALERRLTTIESNQRSFQQEVNGKIDVVIKLGLGIMASVTGLIIQSLWGLIVKRRGSD